MYESDIIDYLIQISVFQKIEFMKSKNTSHTHSNQTLQCQNNWTQSFKQHLQNVKKPFLNRVELSKLRVQSRMENFENEKKALIQYETIIQPRIEKFFLPSPNSPLLQGENLRQSTHSEQQTQKQISLKKNHNHIHEDDSEQQKQNCPHADSYMVQWPGRNKQRIFKNSSNMVEQFDKMFTKKVYVSRPMTKNETYSYSEDEKEMLSKIYKELKHEKQNYVQFQKLYKFFDDCKLFLKVYGINPSELQDIVSCSAYKYPNKLTRQQFFEFFLVNSQSLNYSELQRKVQKVCCLEQQHWEQIQQLFSQLDTFGDGIIKTKEFFQKTKTISFSKQLMNSNTIHFTKVNRFYTFSKILFELQHKKKSLPQALTWSELQSQIINFEHIDFPTIDDIFSEHIQKGYIVKETNAFLLKGQTLNILKEQFQRCPKFSQIFVKCKYFCEELMNMDSIRSRSAQYVRNNPNAKGFINLSANIRILQIQGPQYFDMDEMLTYFSVRGFQAEIKEKAVKSSFGTQSTTSQEQFQSKKREKRRVTRMKSLDQMQKIMKDKTQKNILQQNKKPAFKPVTVEQFNLTKPRNEPTIRQTRIIQMLEQKERKQVSQIKPFVKANLIPASINCQRYMEQAQKKQNKRKLQRHKRQKQRDQDDKKLRYLISNTKIFDKTDPFLIEQQRRKFLSPQPKQQFEAKPISWFIKQKNLLEVIEGQKQERRKNRLKQTKQKYVFGYWKSMPYEDNSSNFKKLTIAQNIDQQKDKNNDSIELKIRQINGSLKDDATNQIKSTPVPDFAKLQRQFIEDLESKKKMRNPTVVKQFKLSVNKKKQPQVQGLENQPHKRAISASRLNKKLDSSQNVTIKVTTTKKFQGMVGYNQQKIAQKKLQAQLNQLQEKQRKNKQKVFAKFMKKALNQDLKKHRNSSAKNTRKSVCNKDFSQIEHDNQLKKIYERVLSRPFLFQSTTDEGNQQSNKRATKNNAHKKNKSMRSVPKEVKIPRETEYNNMDNDSMQIFDKIPPLNYIQEQQQLQGQQNYRFADNQDSENDDQDDGQYQQNVFDTQKQTRIDFHNSKQMKQHNDRIRYHEQEKYQFQEDNEGQNLNRSF